MIKNLDKIQQRLRGRVLVFEKEGIFQISFLVEDVYPYIEDVWWMVDLKVTRYLYATDLDGRNTVVDAIAVPLASIQNLFHLKILDELYNMLKHYGVDSYTYRLVR